MLQRSLAELSAQIEQIKARDRELQQQLEKMRVDYDQRLERLEKGATPRRLCLPKTTILLYRARLFGHKVVVKRRV